MRKGEIKRETRETKVEVLLELDGKGEVKISTTNGFFDHMLKLLARYSMFDLKVSARGDLQHHIVEDVGICLGKAFETALGNKKGVARFGFFLLPMDEVLARCALDISGRPMLCFETELEGQVDGFDAELLRDFMQAFCSSAKLTLHVDLVRGTNKHHKIEAIFKCLGKALRQAVEIDERSRGKIPSTKGMI